MSRCYLAHCPDRESSRAESVEGSGFILNRGLDVNLSLPAPPNYPLRLPKYHLIETKRPLTLSRYIGGSRYRLLFQNA